MYRVVERELLEFIIPGGTKKWIILRESWKYFMDCFVMYNTETSHVNGMKDFWREGIKLCYFIFIHGYF